MKPLLAEHFSARQYLVRHLTEYRYSDDVTASYGRACLRPRETESQRVLGTDIHVRPTPEVFTEHVDFFGNYSHYLELQTRHRELVVLKTSTVDVARVMPDLAALDRWSVGEAAASRSGREAPSKERDQTAVRAGLRLPSSQIELGPEVRAYAAEVMHVDQPLGQGLDELVSRIFADFRYQSGATTVRTTLPELLQLRAGVCQDFAHLAIACLRSFGLPARYVSGYLETQPPPGKPKLQGSDATHAWLGVGLPDGGWLELDPTNNCVADSRHIVTAWGRDYRDVAPLKGVIFTEGATSTLDVKVDVTRVYDPAIPEEHPS